MLTKERRPMTEAERKIVQEALFSVTKRKGWVDRFVELLTGLGCGFVLSGFLIFLALAVWEWLANPLHKPGLSPTVDTCLTFCLVGGLLGAILYGRREYQKDREARREAEKMGQVYQQDLEAGESEVWHCDVSRVVQLVEQEDEGPGFFLELAPGQALFLQGHYFYDFLGNDFGLQDEEEVSKPQSDEPGIWPPPPRTGSSSSQRVFPCRQFDLVYAPNSRMPLADLVCWGERFEKWPKYSPDWQTHHKMNCYPADGDILPVSLDTLDADLMRWAAGQEQGKT